MAQSHSNYFAKGNETKRNEMHLQSIDAEIGNSKCVQVNPPLQKPSSICSASDDILLCADDTQRGIIPVSLNYNGVGIADTGLKLVNYPTGIKVFCLGKFLNKRLTLQLMAKLVVCTYATYQAWKLR